MSPSASPDSHSPEEPNDENKPAVTIALALAHIHIHIHSQPRPQGQNETPEPPKHTLAAYTFD